MIERFLDHQPEFEPLALDKALSRQFAEHVNGPGLWQVLPAGDHDGFTVQVVRRRA